MHKLNPLLLADSPELLLQLIYPYNRSMHYSAQHVHTYSKINKKRSFYLEIPNPDQMYFLPIHMLKTITRVLN